MDAGTREFVRNRANGRCEYCRFQDISVPYLVFHVDHIIAKQHLDVISDDPNELAWACSECNYHKGPNLASIDPLTGDQVSIFHPRKDNWELHFALQNGVIVGKTAIGRATARLLKMNSSRLIRLRKALVILGEF